jgi:hypothetical protein
LESPVRFFYEVDDLAFGRESVNPIGRETWSVPSGCYVPDLFSIFVGNAVIQNEKTVVIVKFAFIEFRAAVLHI